jgi:hypothetical protein
VKHSEVHPLIVAASNAMRLGEMRHGEPAPATRRLHVSRKGRMCAVCRKPLSVYNPDEVCAPCWEGGR